MNVLIIEPDATQRKGLALALSSRFLVEQAATPAEAWRHLKKTYIDVVITELHFNIHDGLEMLNDIARLSGHSRIIVTSNSSKQFVEQNLEIYSNLI